MKAQLEAKEDHLMQEPVSKFSLSEMWEVAFHNLASLQPREAFTMIKGAMDHPEKIRTLDNSPTLPRKFAYGLHYRSLEAMQVLAKTRQQMLDGRIETYLTEQATEQKRQKRKRQDSQAAEPEEVAKQEPSLDLPPDE